MIEYYDKQGKSITLLDWGMKMENTAYKTVGIFKRGGLHISTIWLGIDYRFGIKKGQPVIFESVGRKYGRRLFQYRWTTLDEAVDGHRSLVKKYRHNILVRRVKGWFSKKLRQLEEKYPGRPERNEL